jgi:DNA-binding SARP family transcriptional activator/uncharacterized protein HemY
LAADIKFGLLGPLEVHREAQFVAIAAGRQRALLAALLLNANTVVPADDLIGVLWGAVPPASARASLHNYVKRLRKVLGDQGHARIVTRSQGYLINVGPGGLDVTQFEELLAGARTAAADGDWEVAARGARAALALWRGEPLADTGSEALAAQEVPRLAELRLQALEVAIDAALQLGQHAEVISELQRLAAGHPLRERLHALLMLALYRDGRQAEALAAYQRARRVLVEELGTEPGIGLSDLHQQILTADPSLAAGLPGPSRASETAMATRTLPRDVTSFTGREGELARLVGSPAGPVAAVQVIGGMPGVGKTALTVHAAHRLASRFCDGQLFLPLHGHTPGRRPVEPGDALATLLQAAGVSAAQIPPGLQERTWLWRDRMAGRQVLLVLDDAVDSEQVEPLLPGTAGSLVLVTSRRHLTALQDAHTVSLEVLPPEEAAALLVRLAARPGLRPGDAAVADICALCGHLPLAIGMLARQLHHHPAWTAAGLAADLAAGLDRLEFMTAENRSVAAGFDLSYADLTGSQQRLFRRLGLHPGGDIDAYAAAALDGRPLAATRRELAALYDHYLLTEPAAGRYRLHDLIREYARSQAGQQDEASGREEALAGLLDYYTQAATLAEVHLSRQAPPCTRPLVTEPPPDLPGLRDRAQALTWARSERMNLLACLDHAAEAGQQAQVVALTAALASLLKQDGPWADALARHGVAAQAAKEAGDRRGQANALINLGVVRHLTGDYPGAAQALEHALALARDLGDRQGQANALVNLGVVRSLTDDYPGAAQLLERALALTRDLGDRHGQTDALNYLGVVRRKTGDYPGAALALEAALTLARDLGDRHGQAKAISNLGRLRYMTGDHTGAEQALEAALALARDLGNRLGQANILTELGIVRRLAGNYLAASVALEDALHIFREFGEPGGEAEALNEAGTVYRMAGDLTRAEACHRQALELSGKIGSPFDQAQALAGLGRSALAAGRASDAKAGLQQAQQIFRRIGAAETGDVGAELDALRAEAGPSASNQTRGVAAAKKGPG